MDGRCTCSGSPTFWPGELMAPLVSTIEINHPQDEVFAYVTDPARSPSGRTASSAAAWKTARRPAVGSKCVTTRRIGGAERNSTSEVTKLEPPTSWAVHGIDGPIRAIVERHRRTARRQRPVARDDRARFRGARHRQAARAAHRPPPSPQARCPRTAPAQATPRGDGESRQSDRRPSAPDRKPRGGSTARNPRAGMTTFADRSA